MNDDDDDDNNNNKSYTLNHNQNNVTSDTISSNNNRTIDSSISPSSIEFNSSKNPLLLLLEENKCKEVKEKSYMSSLETIEINSKIIEDAKKRFLQCNQQQEHEQNSSSLNQSKLKMTLLMNIIENRQRTLTQRIQFEADLQRLFVHVNNSKFSGKKKINNGDDNYNIDDADNSEDMEYMSNIDMNNDHDDDDNLYFYSEL